MRHGPSKASPSRRRTPRSPQQAAAHLRFRGTATAAIFGLYERITSNITPRRSCMRTAPSAIFTVFFGMSFAMPCYLHFDGAQFVGTLLSPKHWLARACTSPHCNLHLRSFMVHHCPFRQCTCVVPLWLQVPWRGLPTAPAALSCFSPLGQPSLVQRCMLLRHLRRPINSLPCTSSPALHAHRHVDRHALWASERIRHGSKASPRDLVSREAKGARPASHRLHAVAS